MKFNTILTKNELENIIVKSYLIFKKIHCFSIIDSLKSLGFFYATHAGFSIGLDDLKLAIPQKILVKEAIAATHALAKNWKKGFQIQSKRFKFLIESWSSLTDRLQKELIKYYKNVDPYNALYVMSSTGARGNMVQVQQIIGFRGLLVNQAGKVIEMAIEKNFKSGLTVSDYIISSYGARKGIIDTALKTASSGYLTRKLVYLTQNIIITQKNCKSQIGLYIKNNSKTETFIGKRLIAIIKKNKAYALSSRLLSFKAFHYFMNKKLSFIFRFFLGCNLLNSICLFCYGYDLNQKNKILLGDAVGITAAQSIGEPGTQLTMRTFHTGGVFSGAKSLSYVSNISGYLLLESNANNLDISLHKNYKIIDLKGNLKTFILPKKFKITKKKSGFIFNKDLLGQKLSTILIKKNSEFYLCKLPISGKFNFSSPISFFTREFNENRVNLNDKFLYISHISFLSLSKSTLLKSKNFFSSKKPFAFSKLIVPHKTFVCLYKKNDFLKLKVLIDKKVIVKTIFFLKFKEPKSFSLPILNLLVKSYQSLDSYSLIGYFYYFLSNKKRIYKIFYKGKEVTKQLATYYIYHSGNTIEINQSFSSFSLDYCIKSDFNRLNSSNFLLQNFGCKLILYKITPFLLSQFDILCIRPNSFFKKNSVFAYTKRETFKASDITQGIPVIEKILERNYLRKTKSQTSVSGLFLSQIPLKSKIKFDYSKNLIINLISFKKTSHKVFNHILLTRITNYFQILKFNNRFYFLRKLYNLTNFNEKKQISDKICLINKNKNNNLLELVILANKKFKKKNKNIDLVKVYSTFKNQYIIELKNNLYYNLIPFRNIRICTEDEAKKFKNGTCFFLGEVFKEEELNPAYVLLLFFNYFNKFNSLLAAIKKSIFKIQLLLVECFQGIYASQSVKISLNYSEMVIRAVTTYVKITVPGNSPFSQSEIIKLNIYENILNIFKKKKNNYTPLAKPVLESMITVNLSNQSFIASMCFQQTKRILLKSAVKTSFDWFENIRESIVANRKIPVKANHLKYKSYLDSVYTFKIKYN